MNGWLKYKVIEFNEWTDDLNKTFELNKWMDDWKYTR